MQPGPTVNWEGHPPACPIFLDARRTSSMTNHALRLRNRDGRAPLFRGVNTPRAKNERLPWKCYGEA